MQRLVPTLTPPRGYARQEEGKGGFCRSNNITPSERWRGRTPRLRIEVKVKTRQLSLPRHVNGQRGKGHSKRGPN